MKKIVCIIVLTMVLTSCGSAGTSWTNFESTTSVTEEKNDNSKSNTASEEAATPTPTQTPTPKVERLWSSTRFVDSTGLSEGKVVSLIETDKGNYKAVTDESGNLLFYYEDTVEHECTDMERFSNGYMSTVYNGIYYVIDESGNISSSYNWDSVRCYGAGYTWIEYFTGNSWDSEGYYYYKLYDPAGNEVTDISMEGKYDENTMYELPRAKISYLGDGVFCYYSGYGYPDVFTSYYFTSTKEWKQDIKTFSEYENIEFNDGSSVPLYVTDNMVDYDEHTEEERHAFTILDSNGNIQQIQIPDEYLSTVTSMFTDKWAPDILGHSQNYFLFHSRYDGYFVYNRDTNEFKKYDGKYSEQTETEVENAGIYGNIFAMPFYGADDNRYVGLINVDTMEEIGEPIAGRDLSFQDGVLSIVSGDTNYYYNLQGEKIGEFPTDGVTLKYRNENALVVRYDENNACSIEHYDRTPLFLTISTDEASKTEFLGQNFVNEAAGSNETEDTATDNQQ